MMLFNIVRHSMDGWHVIVSGIHCFHVRDQGAMDKVIDNIVGLSGQLGCNLTSTVPMETTLLLSSVTILIKYIVQREYCLL